MNKSKMYPNNIDPQEIADNAVRDLALAFRKFNECQTIPKFESSVDTNARLGEFTVDDLDELLEDLATYKKELKEFLLVHDLDPDTTGADAEDSVGQFAIGGGVWDSASEWAANNFYDWAYHRHHDNINVLQFLMGGGGPSFGIWIHRDGSIEYWTRWWGAGASAFFRGEDLKQARMFFETMLECHEFEFDCPHGLYSFTGEGLMAGMTMLQCARRSDLHEMYDEEDSE